MIAGLQSLIAAFTKAVNINYSLRAHCHLNSICSLAKDENEVLG